MLAAAVSGLDQDVVVKDLEGTLQKINKASFEEFYEAYKKKRAQRAKTAKEKSDWENLYSMYDMEDCYSRWAQEIGQQFEAQRTFDYSKSMGETSAYEFPDFYDLPLPEK